MFHFLATTKCKRQQIAILIISFFAYVAGIRNEGNNMLLQQQALLQQQQTIIENSDNTRKSPEIDTKQQSALVFRPSQVIDFTPADAALPQQLKPTYTETQQPTNNVKAIQYSHNNNQNIHDNVPQKQGTQTSNRRYAIQTATTYAGDAAEKPFSFPNEQQQTQIPQHLTDKPIYIYRDPFTNENYHYTPTETNVKETTAPTTYNHNNYNNGAYKQHNLQQHLQHNDNNQEYLVQSSMTVGTHQLQLQQQQLHQQEINPLRPYMSLSADKDVYLKRPGFVYDDDEKPAHSLLNSVIDKKSQVNKISYDSHDYPPPSYFQQQTSNFLPTPVPPSAPKIKPTAPTKAAPYRNFRPPLPTHSALLVHQQSQSSQSSQSALPNYANNIDNYFLNKQQTNEFYRTETPPPSYAQQLQMPFQYENRPPFLEYGLAQPTTSSPNEHKQQYFTRPPPPYSAQIPYRPHEPARPPPGRPSYNNYYGYQIGEIPPQAQTTSSPSQHFNYPYPRPPPHHYSYQGPHIRPTPPPPQQSGLAALAQYAPQFTSLLLGGVGGGNGGGDGDSNSNYNGPLSSLIGALTGATISQPSSLSSSLASSNRKPINSQLIKALENIARNDDLQCVPKVLCQMIAAQTQRGQLPTFITSPAITNFLAGFPEASAALIYGRAALLALSGGAKSCHQTYAKCPKDEYEIIYYLNNHRGGFFKLFSEPEEQQQIVNHGPTQQSATSLFSILSAFAGAPQRTTTTQRPTPKPQAPITDVTSGITNFFSQLFSDSVGGATVEYQRKFKRRTERSLDGKIKFEGQSEETQKDTIKFDDGNFQGQREVLKFKDQSLEQGSEEYFHDEEDEEDTQYSTRSKDVEPDYVDPTESRILDKNLEKDQSVMLFPNAKKESLDKFDFDEELKQKIKEYNDYNKERKLKFPTATDDRMYTEVLREKLGENTILNEDSVNRDHIYGHHFTNYVENSFDDFDKKKTQQVKFIDHHKKDNEKQGHLLYINYLKNPNNLHNDVIFPKREGKIVNHFNYAASYLQSYPQEQQSQPAQTAYENKFLIPNIPTSLHYTERPSPSSSFNAFNIYTDSLEAHNLVSSNNVYDNTENNPFLPTLPPPLPENDAPTSSNSISSNQNYSNNQHNENYYLKSPSAEASTSNLINYNNDVQKSAQLAHFNRYHSSSYTTRRPYDSDTTTDNSANKNIYVTNSRGVTEYYITPDGRRVYL